MIPWQQLENSATCSFDISSQSLCEEALVDACAMAPEGSLFHGIQRNDGTTVCSILDELMNTMPNCMCADNLWHDHGFTHGGYDNAEDECSLSFWENLIEPVSQSQTSDHNATSSPCTPISPLCFSGETSGTIPMFVQPLPFYSEASSVAAYQHDSYAAYINNHLTEHLNIKPYTRSNSTNSLHKFSSSFLSGESPGICLANTDTSFVHPSPVCSEASSFAVASQHDSFYMSNHSSEHLDKQMDIHENGTNSVHASISPKFSNGNVCMTYSGSTASNIASSDDDLFDSEASSLAAFASAPPHDLNLAFTGAVNLASMASWPQLYEASSYSMDTAGAGRNPKVCAATKSEDIVTFLVETSTPAIEDGYVWRKYGQKNIKDRVHPRSYFRCAQPNCLVKKQIESSSDEQGFVLITYFGKHNH